MKPFEWVCSDRWPKKWPGRIAAIFACSLLLASTAYAADDTITLRDAQFVMSDAQTPPGEEADWRPITLPDDWWESRRNVHGYGWYRVSVDLGEAPRRLQAIYCTRMRRVAQVFVNGTSIGQTGNFGEDNTLGNRAHLLPFPAALLKPGRNVVHVRLWVAPERWGALGQLQIGDAIALRQAFERERFAYDGVAEIAFTLALVMSAFGLAVWWRRRNEAMLGYFSLTALAWACQISINTDWWPALPALALWPWMLENALRAAKYTFLVLYALRFGGWVLPRVERAFLGWMLASLLLLYLLEYLRGPQGTVTAYQYWASYGVWAVPGCLALLIILLTLRRAPLAEGIPLLLAHILSVVGSIMSNVYELSQAFGGVQYMLVHMLPLLLVMGWIVARRFAVALESAEALNKDLTSRVEAKRVELEANYRRLAELEREQAVMTERARLMSDMHDGIGAQLISTLGLVETGAASKEQVGTALRECIDDLRLAIDSLEPTDEDLLPVLGSLRYRLEPRLKAQGITLDWQVSDVPRLSCLTPANVLQVLRILQEAFTNVLKHAGATVIHVATTQQERGVLIDVSDDGRGFDDAASSRGHGLANMRRRAKAVGGELQLRSSPMGTTLSLLLPMS